MAGKEIKINHVPHIVQGVVKDTSPLLVQSFANIYTVYALRSRIISGSTVTEATHR